jgi:hypothetical protein
MVMRLVEESIVIVCITIAIGAAPGLTGEPPTLFPSCPKIDSGNKTTMQKAAASRRFLILFISTEVCIIVILLLIFWEYGVSRERNE